VLKEAPSNPLALHVKESNSYFNAETLKQIKEQHTILTSITWLLMFLNNFPMLAWSQQVPETQIIVLKLSYHV
jgi:hypothetical protein